MYKIVSVWDHYRDNYINTHIVYDRYKTNLNDLIIGHECARGTSYISLTYISR